MRRTVLYFLQLTILIGIAVWLSDHPGRVEIEWLGYHIETYLGILLLLACLLILLVTVLDRSWRGLAGAPGTFLSSRRQQRREDGYRALVHGMTAVAVGDREEAKRLAQRADTLLQDPDITRLLSAQAASLNGDEAAARRYFLALSESPATAFLGFTGLMRQAMREGDEERTLEYAAQAHRLRPESGAVLAVLFDLQTRRGNWADAQTTLFGAVRRGIRSEATALGDRATILTARALEAEQAEQTNAAISWAEKALATQPGAVPAALIRARAQAAQGRVRKAALGLEEVWGHMPHPDIAAAYVQLWGDEPPLERYRRLRHLVGEKACDMTGRLVLAAAALDAKLWGDARRNLAAIIADGPTALGCRLMARLEDEERGDIAAARDWRIRADSAGSDLDWTCGSCGAVSPAWSALCGNCRSFATVTWKPPPRVTVLAAAPDGDATAVNAAAVLADGNTPERRTP